jgi:TonB-linked SusC/RagA family outer membrane protein
LLICNAEVFAQDKIQNTKISFEINNASIRSILKEVKKQTNFDFVYNGKELADKKISINVKDATIDEVMNKCLENTNFSYKIKGKIIMIIKKAGKIGVQDKPKWVTGSVTDTDENPLPGASVVIKDTYTGVSTDMDGKYRIKLPNNQVTYLVYSCVGMEPKEVKIIDQKLENIVLKRAVAALNEVVITGMEKIQENRVTGVATVITSRELQDQGISSIDDLFEGKIAGLNTTTISGALGTRSKITIRGENSLTGNTEPLWILDGLPMTTGVPKNNSGDYAGTIMQDGVGNIMPEDIASITILKDAAASAIYGAKAANGVIVITTKKGFRSKTQFNYSGNYSYSTSPNIDLDFMNSAEKLQYETGIVEDFGIYYAEAAGRGGRLWKDYYNGYISQQEYENEITKLSFRNTDWFDQIFNAAKSQSHNVSVRGGSETLSYYTSVSYTDRKGILKPNSSTNTGVLVNLEYRPNKKLIANFSVSGNARSNKNHASAVDPFKYAMFANPYEQAYGENGKYASDLTYLPNNTTDETTSGYKFDSFNILRELNGTKTQQNGLDLSLTFNLKYNILKSFSVQSIFRKSISHNSAMIELNPGTYASFFNSSIAKEAFKNRDVIPSAYNDGQLSESSGRNNAWSMRNQIDYSKTIADDHLFSVLLANEITSRKFNNFGYTSPIYDPEYRITGIPSFENEELLYGDFETSLRKLFNTSDGQDRTVSFLGQLRYSFKDKYILNFNARADGADVIGDAEKFTPLWSVSGRWNIDKESFFSKFKHVINQFSLRSSYGFTGNIDRTAYPFSTITLSSDRYLNEYYSDEFAFPNPSVTWAKKREVNVGGNISLFNNFISIDANYYSDRTEDVLSDLRVPASTGRVRVKANGGILENKGFELAVSMRLVKTKDFSFYASGNISRNKNVIVKAYNGLNNYKDAIRTNVRRGGVFPIEGEEAGGIYGWEYAGVHPNSGFPMYYLTDEGKQEYAKILDGWDTFTPDEQEYYVSSGIIPSLTSVPNKVAINKDLNLFQDMYFASMKNIGRSNPKYVGGFSTSMKYKNFSLITYWTYKMGHIIQSFDDRKNAPKNKLSGMGGGNYVSSDLAVSGTNRQKKYLYRWRNSGDITNIPGFTTGRDYFSTAHFTHNYQKGDYLRLKSLVFKYRMPSDFVNKLGFNNMSVSFTANNLLTFTKYKGMDVATENSFAYPTAREYNLRLNVGF